MALVLCAVWNKAFLPLHLQPISISGVCEGMKLLIFLFSISIASAQDYSSVLERKRLEKEISKLESIKYEYETVSVIDSGNCKSFFIGTHGLCYDNGQLLGVPSCATWDGSFDGVVVGFGRHDWVYNKSRTRRICTRCFWHETIKKVDKYTATVKR